MRRKVYSIQKLPTSEKLSSIYSYGQKILDQKYHSNNAYFVLRITVIQQTPNRIAANFLTCLAICHVSHAAMQLLTFFILLLHGNDPLACYCMVMMIMTTLPPRKEILSTRIERKLGN